VQLSYTIDLVRTNQSKVCHADHLRLGFLDDRDAPQHVALFREVPLDELEELQIDFEDNLLWSVFA
jgi:hypothetical protein